MRETCIRKGEKRVLGRGRNLLFNVVVGEFLQHMAVGRQVKSG